MIFAEVETTIKDSLATGLASDKLRALELANQYDKEREIRILGCAVLGRCTDMYVATHADTRLRRPDETQVGHGADFVGYRYTRLFTAVSTALGTSYGVSIEKPKSPAEYSRAAEVVVHSRHRTRADAIGPPREHVLGVAEYAKVARGHNDWLLRSDFTVAGTAYFRDMMKVLNTDTSVEYS